MLPNFYRLGAILSDSILVSCQVFIYKYDLSNTFCTNAAQYYHSATFVLHCRYAFTVVVLTKFMVNM